MRALDTARETCETFLPGLLDKLSGIPLTELEQPGGPAIDLFRSHGGASLVIPQAYQGRGADPLQALAVTRALAARAPSLAVGTTMHHFSVATLFTLAQSLQSSGVEWALLEGIAEQNLLVASGFAEGNPGQGILSPTMTARAAEGGFLINGAKKPCSLSRSMDLLTASVALPNADGGSDMAVLLVPRQTEGLTVHPFWSSWALAGAESEELRLTDVLVNEQQVMRTELGDAGQLDELQTVGFIWFELLISACYLGMASALVERVCERGRGTVSERARLVAGLESANLLLEGCARMIMDGETGNDSLAKSLVARYGAQDALGSAVNQAVELLGGMAFISSPDVAYLAAACHGLSFHPPSRSSFAEPYLDHVAGRPLRLT
ncbi:alkylation response protein AidB-like acyl-CoA dehydrogenase [Kitasatospora sp. MAA4]|uniref:acyl-CoA dehydrogenase family protein n=1 Tax=Kitasatospora sp. MAA4 TaxID=3035093 RepID=UPI002474EE59|nr:acyl-CoA dehydrogenase family protein [Kitasatospora sp. MAA4]MDH6131837.1 alkylation response protein AidB-like acyl-CoA dehydrogenase [Kitasatospora sp. MAA4]